jgi:hypothetical protein
MYLPDCSTVPPPCMVADPMKAEFRLRDMLDSYVLVRDSTDEETEETAMRLKQSRRNFNNGKA